jgi:hypothetical protein
LASLCGEFDLVDVHKHQHIRCSKRLDYCLVSPALVDFLVASGFNLFNEFAHSDHRALFLDIDLVAYLGAKLPKLSHPDYRSVSSSIRHVAKFVSKVYDHMQENKAFHKYQEYLLDVDTEPEPWRLANDIDDVVGQALAIGEAACSSTPQPPWSGPLHKASQKVRYWKTYITARTTGVHQDQVLAELATEIWPDGPPTPPVNNDILRNAPSSAPAATVKRNVRPFSGSC